MVKLFNSLVKKIARSEMFLLYAEKISFVITVVFLLILWMYSGFISVNWTVLIVTTLVYLIFYVLTKNCSEYNELYLRRPDKNQLFIFQGEFIDIIYLDDYWSGEELEQISQNSVYFSEKVMKLLKPPTTVTLSIDKDLQFEAVGEYKPMEIYNFIINSQTQFRMDNFFVYPMDSLSTYDLHGCIKGIYDTRIDLLCSQQSTNTKYLKDKNEFVEYILKSFSNLEYADVPELVQKN